MNYLRFETPAFIYLGPFMNSDGITINAGLSTLSQADIWLQKNNSVFGSLADTSAITYSMLGMYRVPLGSADLSAKGRLKIVCNKTTALPVWDDWAVLDAKVYDSLIFGSDNVEVDVTQWNGTAVHASSEAGTPCVEVVRYGGNDVPATSINGVPKVDLAGILGTALTETAGYLAAGFKKFFNVLAPTGTLLSLPDAVPGANGGLPTQNGTKINQTVDLTAGQTIGANLVSILGTALTETAGYLAAGFKKFFNVLNPTGTLLSIPDAVPGANNGLPTTNGSKMNQTVDLTAGQTIAANVTQLGGVVQSLTDLKDFADSGYDPATHKVQGVVLTDSVTGMALEATLTAMKGVGWTTETLHVIYDAVVAAAPPTKEAIRQEIDTNSTQLLAIVNHLLAMKGVGWTTQTLVTLQAAIAAIDVSGVADAVCNEDMTGHVAPDSLGYYMRAIYALANGRLKIDDATKQLILYMPDNLTEIARWNLLNSVGAPASSNVFDRQKV